MSPMNPRLLRPIASRATLPPYSPVAYARLWAVTTQPSGDIEGSAESDTGYYAVKWWDSSVDVYGSGDPFSKAAAGNPCVFEVYPSDASGEPSGAFEGFDVSGNGLTHLRADNVTLPSFAGAQTGGYQTYYGSWLWGPYFSPTYYTLGRLANNLLSAESLDQFYSDLDAGDGYLLVGGNAGIEGDDPTIATAKGYTVFGSEPPSTSLLLNFNGSNGSTSFADSSFNEFSVDAIGGAEISDGQSKFGGASGYFDGIDSALEIPTSGLMAFGPEDFTVELWFFYNEGDNFSESVLFSQASPEDYVGIAVHMYQGDLMWLAGIGNGWEFQRYPSGGHFAAGSATDAQWNHIAVTRSGETFRLFVNGQLVDSYDYAGSLLDTNQLVSIGGRSNYGQHFQGHIDDLRVIKGAALYTANFTPPASQLGVYP